MSSAEPPRCTRLTRPMAVLLFAIALLVVGVVIVVRLSGAGTSDVEYPVEYDGLLGMDG